jgi:hypothetical protein
MSMADFPTLQGWVAQRIPKNSYGLRTVSAAREKKFAMRKPSQ